ncbi:MAG TPA: hypothetical protein VMU94_03515 [Streptosporangiaceae bacterium]|nr:hypothetical protein [Streptosporangiaceae bacterium]
MFVKSVSVEQALISDEERDRWPFTVPCVAALRDGLELTRPVGGRGPVGLDAAILCYYSLPAPGTAERVYRTFQDILSTPAGTVAQLYAIARLLARAGTGDHPDLAEPLRRRSEQLTAAPR